MRDAQRTAAGMTPAEIQEWQDSLGLSDAEAADTLCLSNRNSIMREYKNPGRAKVPAAPTVCLMETTAEIAAALIFLRRGKVDDARRILEMCVGGPVLRHVHAAAPEQTPDRIIEG